MTENADKAATKIEERVGAANNTLDDSVRNAINDDLKTNNITTTADLQQVNQRLQTDGVLPTLVLDQKKQDELIQKYGTADGQNLDVNKLRAGAADDKESPYNRMLAQALVDRANKIDSNGDNQLSRTEMKAWADGQKGEAGKGGNKIEVKGDPNKPDSITRTNVNGESETITKSGDKWSVVRKNADGSTTTTEATNVKSDGQGGYTYESNGAKVEQKADGTRVVTNTKSGDVTTTKTDDNGRIKSIEHKDKSGRLSETITSDGKVPPTYSVDINGGQGGHFTVTDVQSKGDSYSYKDSKGTKYEQETERDVRTVTSADGKNVTRYNFGDDGKPTYISNTTKNPDGSETKIEIKQENGKYFYTDAKGQKTEIQQPSVWHGGFSFKSLDGKNEMLYGSDGTQKRTETTENGTKSVTVNPDGSSILEEKSKDGTKTKRFEVDKDNNITKIEDNNGTTTTTIASDGKGGYTKTVHTNDGSKPDQTVAVSDVQADAEGKYTYKQQIGENGRKFTFDNEGNVKYDVVSGDNLWSISKDLLTAQLGRAPNNGEIWAMINGIAAENGIKNPNLIYPKQNFKIPKAA